MSEDSSQRLTWVQATLSVTVFVVAWIWLSLRPRAPLHPDTSRDLAFARDLADGSEFHGNGAWASFAHLEQGTTFVDLLALAQRVGFDLGELDGVLTTALALAIALLHVGLRGLSPTASPSATTPGPAQPRAASEDDSCPDSPPLATRDRKHDRRLRALAPLIGALAVLALVPAVIEVPILWQPTLLPLPIVLAHLSLWRLLRDGALVDALALAVFGALALDVHVVSVAFVLPALAAVPLASARPLLATVASLATLAVTLLTSSPIAWLDNIETASSDGWLAPGALALAAALGLGLALRGRFTALAWSRRVAVIIAVELALVAGLALASVPESTPPASGRYFGPFIPVVGLALAWAASRSRVMALAATASTLVLALYGFAWLRPAPERSLPLSPRWTIAEFQPVGAAIVERGATWTELVGRIQGPDSSTILGHLSALVEPGPSEPPPADAGMLIVALDPAEAAAVLAQLPADPERTTLIELDGLHALILEAPARSDRYGARLCVGECEAVELAIVRRVDQAHPNAWIDGEVALHEALAAAPEPVTEIHWRVPIRPGPRTLVLLTSNLAERCAWRIVDVQGFEVDDALPTHELVVPADVEGELVVGRELALEGLDERGCVEPDTLPPSLIELPLEWTKLRELLQPRWTRVPTHDEPPPD